MTVKKEEEDVKVGAGDDYEPDIVATAVPTGESGVGPGGKEPPIPPDHARFYCHKCHTVRRM